MADLEILVVVDGADPETEAVLAALDEPRLAILVNAEPGGAAAARNAGVQAARGEWIAFLDDDDLWLPTKLDRQLDAIATAEVDGVAEPISFSARIVRLPDGRDLAWRDRGPGPAEHPSDYMFVRRSLRLGESSVSTSTIVARRSLLLAVPFDTGAQRFDDADWVLRAWAAGARLVYCPERLSIWRAQVGAASITGRYDTDWRHGLRWIQARRDLVTRRAYAAFLLVRVAAMAERAGERRAAGIVWREAWRHGRPGLPELVLFAGRWIVPSRLRVAIRHRYAIEPDGGHGRL
jgi:glycosyltransferase involved in cell wall biosynthesis